MLDATTLGQAGIWYADQKVGGTSAFNVSTVLTVSGDVSVEDVRRACRRLARAVPELRLRLGLDEWTGEVVQWLCPEPLELRVQSHSAAWLDAEAARLFETDGGALARFAVASVSPDRILVGITVHHAILDGAAQIDLAHRFAACMTQEPAPRPIDGYLSLTAAVRAAEEHARTDHLPYWRERVATMTGPAPRPLSSEDGVTRRYVLHEPSVGRLEARAAELGTRVFHLLAAAVHRCVHALDPEQHVIAAATSLRPPTGEPSGCFLNQIPLTAEPAGRAGPAGRAEPAELLALLRLNSARWTADLRHRAFPFLDLAQLTKVTLDRVLVSYRRTPARLPTGDPRVTAELLRPYPRPKADLGIRFFHDRTLEYEVQWRPSAWPRAVEGLGDDLARCLEEV
ncbi:hypothetical protein GCM10009850_030930 [Nonomuraea monospora]|uniref:Condensation domain-containing protein n=1 Tax=Nonomuraea monospora TaxID=568818 RepID=A0ABN3CFU6_9ACTN